MSNFYLSGQYVSGAKYFEKEDSAEALQDAATSIRETYAEFVKMGEPKEHANYVVIPTGLQLIEEIDD